MATLTTTISYGEPTGSIVTTLGTPGPQGQTGGQGPQGIQGPQGVQGVGVLAGGLTSQILAKASNADFDTVWANPGTVAWGDIVGDIANQGDLVSSLAEKAAIESPTFTGTVVIPAGADISGYLTSDAASIFYLTKDAAGYTYQPLSDMSNYLTVINASTTYQTVSGMVSYAFKASPTFTGTVTVPTPATSSNTTVAASTAFVKAQGYSTLASPTFTGDPKAPTPATSDNDTSIATTAFVKAQGYSTIASPTFTGTVTIPSGASISGYLTSSTAASVYQTLSGMSAYLTTASAAITYAVTDRGLPASGTVGQVLSKVSGTSYDVTWSTIVPGDRYLTTSTTSNSIANGAKTFTVGTGLSYTTQQDVTIAYDASHHMHALVTSYNSGTGVLVVDVQQHTGTGTYTAWTVNVGGTVPAQSVTWGDVVGTLGDQSDLSAALNAKLEITDAAATYYPLSGNPSSFLTPGDLTPYLTISDASLTYASISYVSTTFFPIAGGAITAGGNITVNDWGIDSDSEMAGFGFGVQKSSDHTKGATLEFDGVHIYDGGNAITISPTTITFPDATTQTTSATNLGYISQGTADGLYYSISNPSGFTSNYFNSTDAIQAVSNSYASSVSNNPSTGNYLKYDGMNLVWDTPGGGGGTTWGSISGNISDQTDLNSALADKYPTSNPNGWTSYGDSQAIYALSGGATSSVASAASGGQFLTYDSGSYALRWVNGVSAPSNYNSVWAYGGWYNANTTSIYDGMGMYYTVLTF